MFLTIPDELTCLAGTAEATPARIARLRNSGNTLGAELLNVLHSAKTDDVRSNLAAAGYGPQLPMESATLPWPWEKA